MRIPRIYSSQIISVGDCIQLKEGPAHRITSVLRMNPGQRLVVFNGLGGEYSGELVEAKKGSVSVQITAFKDIDRESPLHIHLGIGISRGDRMDWIIQKATELGVTAITPLFTERCEVKLSGERRNKKHRHWQQVAISACEQSQRNAIPLVNAPADLDPWLSSCAQHLKLVLHHRTAQCLADMALSTNSIVLLIGPEGGLSDNEIHRATNSDFLPLALGPRVLRTETAPLAAISILQAQWGDMNSRSLL